MNNSNSVSRTRVALDARTHTGSSEVMMHTAAGVVMSAGWLILAVWWWAGSIGASEGFLSAGRPERWDHSWATYHLLAIPIVSLFLVALTERWRGRLRRLMIGFCAGVWLIPAVLAVTIFVVGIMTVSVIS